jgi:hypothetical protein
MAHLDGHAGCRVRFDVAYAAVAGHGEVLGHDEIVSVFNHLRPSKP